jgi:GGDEF domain-containing protein
VALLLEGSDADGIDFHERLSAALESLASELPFAVRATVGTSRLGADDATSLSDALERADAALYERKSRARSGADS